MPGHLLSRLNADALLGARLMRNSIFHLADTFLTTKHQNICSLCFGYNTSSKIVNTFLKIFSKKFKMTQMTHVTNNLTPINPASSASFASFLQPQTLLPFSLTYAVKIFTYGQRKEKMRARISYPALTLTILTII